MKEALSIETERMDDIPLLFTHMHRMHLATLLDKHIPTHAQWKGLSVGELSVVWLAHILSQADHRMNRVQEWAMRWMKTLRGCGMDLICQQDLTDDRLADILRLLSNDAHWHAFEQELMGQLLRVYDLPATCREVILTVVSAPGFTQRHVMPLSPLQQQILALFGFSPAVYLGLADDS